MHIGEGHHLFIRLFHSFGPIVPAIFMFACTLILGEISYIFKIRKEDGRKSSIKYFIWRMTFYLYLMMMYIQTGIAGAFWWSMPRIHWDRIYLIPFTTSSDIVPYFFNILMLMPLGFLLPFIWPGLRSIKKVAICAFSLSAGIEFIQLFSLRVSSTSDLIVNTAGAVIGYGIFCTLNKFLNRELKDQKIKTTSKLLKNEGALYLALSFIGIVFLYHPAISSILPQTGRHEGIMVADGGTVTESGQFIPDDLKIPDNMDVEEIYNIIGSVHENLNDRIIIEKFRHEMLEGTGETLVSMPGEDVEKIEIHFTEATTISTYSGNWQNPTITIVNIDDIELEDHLTIFGYFNENQEFTAIEIKIMRTT